MNQLGELAGRAVHQRRVVAVRGLLTEFAPIWWVARAYFAVGAVALASGASWSQTFGAVPRIGSGTIGLVVIALVTVASVALGLVVRKTSRPTGRIASALNAALLIAAVPVAFHVVRDLHQGPPVSYAFVTVPEAQPGLVYNGTPLSTSTHTIETAAACAMFACTTLRGHRSTCLSKSPTRSGAYSGR